MNTEQQLNTSTTSFLQPYLKKLGLQKAFVQGSESEKQGEYNSVRKRFEL